MPPEVDAWSDLRSRRRALAVAVVAMFAVDIGALLTPSLRGLPCVAVTAVAVTLAFRCQRFRCPACGGAFGRRGLLHNALTRSCLHCSTRIGAEVPR